MLVEPQDVKVQIKEDLKKCLILNLRSRLAIGVVLGFVGWRHEVIPILQTLSHSTRAYIINANGLTGFLLSMNLIRFLQEADQDGKLESAKKYQVIDFQKIIEGWDNDEQQKTYLSRNYPSLYRYVITELGTEQSLTRYETCCQSLENDHKKFSLYLHGYFLPWIEK